MPLIVSGIQALMQPVPDLERLSAQRRVLRVGDREELDGLLLWLVESGLQRTSAPVEPRVLTLFPSAPVSSISWSPMMR